MKQFKLLAMGLLTLMACVSMVACSNDGPSEEDRRQEELQGLIELLHLKRNLCLVDEKGEPVKVIFGKPYNASTPSERVYYTKSASTAKSRFKLLFADSTSCSADGNTYTLSDKQGVVTFSEESGKNGLLATATFDVPGLKGLVTKIYFLDVNEQGTNAEVDYSRLTPGTLLHYGDPWDEAFFITVGSWNDRAGESYPMMLAPYIIRYTKATPWEQLAQSNAYSFAPAKPLVDMIGNYTEEEYITFCNQIVRLLSTEKWINWDGYETTSDFVMHEYSQWDGKSFFLQASFEGGYVSGADGRRWNYITKYEYLLISPDRFEERTQLYTIEDNQLPEAFKVAIPVAYLLGELQQAIDIKYLEE